MDFDDEAVRCSVLGIEYGTLPKAPLLTYQGRTLRSSHSTSVQASRS